MILRKTKINPEAAEVSTTVSFSAADVWNWLNYYAKINHIEYDSNYRKLFFEDTEKKEYLTYYFAHDPRCLGWMPLKHAAPLAEWGFNIALKKGYVRPIEGGYRLSEKVGKRNGRPPKE